MAWDTLERIKANLAAQRIARAGLAEDVAALCARIDDGDDTALPILADALEEAGDERAAGLRMAIAAEKRPSFWAGQNYPWRWAIGDSRSKLARSGRIIGHYVSYSTRSAAFLAMAAALAEPPRM